MECSVCNLNPGEYISVQFIPENKTVKIHLCSECLTEFEEIEGVETMAIADKAHR